MCVMVAAGGTPHHERITPSTWWLRVHLPTLDHSHSREGDREDDQRPVAGVGSGWHHHSLGTECPRPLCDSLSMLTLSDQLIHVHAERL